MHRLKIRQGFTLIEVLIAISILAIVLVSLFKLHIQTVSMNSDVMFNTNAPFLAELKLAELQNTENPIGGTGTFGERFPGYSWEVSVEKFDSEYLGSYDENIKQADLTVLFNDGELIYSVRSYIFKNK